MSGAEHLPSGPYVRGNPFTQHPLEHEHQNLLIGRDNVVTPLASQIINGTSGIHLIVGESGSGRTSILQCLSQKELRHIGSIWAPSDPISRILSEALVAFTNQFNIPPTPEASANELINYLSSLQGPLPLIAFDYNTPSSDELMHLVMEILPVLRKMRAMVIFAIKPNQMKNWDPLLLDSFDKIHYLEGLNQVQIRNLIDKRMHTVSHETIVTDENEINKLRLFSRGNPTTIIRQLYRHLRYLGNPENEPPPEFLTFNVTSKLEMPESISSNGDMFSAIPQKNPVSEPSRPLLSPSFHNSKKTDNDYDAWIQGEPLESNLEIEISSASNTQFEPIVDSLILDDYNSMESEVGWDDEAVHFASRGGIDDFEGDPLYLETEEEPVQVEPFAAWDKSEKNSDELIAQSSENELNHSEYDSSDYVEVIEVEEPISLHTEEIYPPNSQTDDASMNTPTPPRRGGISGLADRSKVMSARMNANLPPHPPTSKIMGIDPLPIPEIIDPYSSEVPFPSFIEPFEEKLSSSLISRNLSDDPMISRPPDIASDGAHLWVQAGSVSPLSKSQSPVSEKSDQIPKTSPEDIVRGLNAFRSPRWDPDFPLRAERLRDVSDADIVVLTAAATRDISPSDDALQARLQVGRSRLSQIFNDLMKNGFLSVRKEGRTRWYRMTAAASQILTEVEQ